jgi:hypothetical protein
VGESTVSNPSATDCDIITERPQFSRGAHALRLTVPLPTSPFLIIDLERV